MQNDHIIIYIHSFIHTDLIHLQQFLIILLDSTAHTHHHIYISSFYYLVILFKLYFENYFLTIIIRFDMVLIWYLRFLQGVERDKLRESYNHTSDYAG